MGLATGAAIGPYSVIAKIGEGGMGEVYRARDSQLNRDVALKVVTAGHRRRTGPSLQVRRVRA